MNANVIEQNGLARRRLRRMASGVVVILAIGLIAGTLAACAPKQPVEASADDQGKSAVESISVEWSPEIDCAICHAMEQESYDKNECGASLHKGQTCMSCHTDESGLQTAHDGVEAGATTPKKLKATEVLDETCLACHYETKQGLIDATKGIVSVTDDQGTVVNPHNPPAEGDHGDMVCSDCHDMHNGKSIQENAKSTCTACHHAGVFECYTCHE